ncbi:hypothetical protein BOVA604_1569 [Bacteroides ovatus]|nr:hypothetical protein BOVA604_1569 [Bacteroides ovatus]
MYIEFLLFGKEKLHFLFNHLKFTTLNILFSLFGTFQLRCIRFFVAGKGIPKRVVL